MKTFSEKQIETAVQWWSDKLRSCKQSGLSAEERSDPANRGYEMAEMLMQISKPRVSEEQIKMFELSLARRIQDSARGDYLCLSVDYDPCSELSDALQDAGIPNITGVLPIKTSMWLKDGGVRVGYGYGAPIQDLLKAEHA